MIVFFVGTRPDIIKMAPVIHAIKGPKRVLHLGQHYTDSLDKEIREEAGIVIDHRLDVPVDRGSGGTFGAVLEGVSKYLGDLREKWGSITCVAYGDTLSAMAGACAAKALGCRAAHVEAGLRSYDMTMPEEVSRITIDSLSDILYAPTPLQEGFLIQEGVHPDKIMVLGNVIVDALYEHRASWELPAIKSPSQTAVMTLHRPENVDSPAILKEVLNFVEVLAMSRNIWVDFPCHPRSKGRVLELLNGSSRINVIDPVSHNRMLTLIASSPFVITDSGGLQEESAIMGKKCITIRKSTERQETIDAGVNVLVSPYTHSFMECLQIAKAHLDHIRMKKVDYGQTPALKIAEHLEKWHG